MSSSANIVLIYPKIGGPFVNLRKKRPMPLGLLNSAVYLVNNYKVIIFDQALHKNWKKDLQKKINPDTLIVGIHVMAGYQPLHALEVSRFVKSISKVPIIWGGVHPSLLAETALKEDCIDFICIGEGEKTLPELAEAIKSGKDISKVKGLCYRKQGKIVFTPEREPVDLNELPDLPYYLLDIKQYNVSGGTRFEKGEMKLSMETSRGCPNDCVFCYNPAFNKRCWRAQSADKVINRIEHLVKTYSVTYLDFIDDAFFTDLERVKKIALGLIEKNIKVKWFLQGVDVNMLIRADDDYLALLEKAGCHVMRMGAESGSAKLLNEMRKKTSTDEVIALNKRLRKYNFICYYYFTVGMPGETEEDLKKSAGMMLQILEDNPNARIMSAFCLTPQPGTKLLDQAKEQGFKVPQTLKEWSRIDGTTIITPWFDKKTKQKLNFLFFTSLFIDKKNQDIIDSGIIRFLCELYRPIARYRMKNLDFRFPPESMLFNLFKKIF
jgi:radical SAM superfamily enzyme YgiQ (UPF0313 family)